MVPFLPGFAFILSPCHRTDRKVAFFQPAILMFLRSLFSMLVLSACLHAAPANDLFANRTVLPATTSATVEQTTAGATLDEGEMDPMLIGGASVWFSWTAPSAGYYAVSTEGSDYDTIAYVFKDTTYGSLSYLMGSDNFPEFSTFKNTSRCLFSAEAGATYYFAIHGHAGTTGQLKLALAKLAAPPYSPNNDIADSAELPSNLPFTVNGSNFDSDSESIDPSSYSKSSSVWYHWTAPAEGPVAISVNSPDLKCSIQGFTREDISRLTPITGDYGNVGIVQRLQFVAKAGVTYWFRISSEENDDYEIEQDIFTLTMVAAPRPVNDDYGDATDLVGEFPLSLNFSNIHAWTAQSDSLTSNSSYNYYSGGSSIWYRWTAGSTGPVAVTVNSDFNPFLSGYKVDYNGSPFRFTFATGSLLQTPSTTRIRFDAVEGTTYYFAVNGEYREQGTGILTLSTAQPPPNDKFADATALSGNVEGVAFSNVDASREPFDYGPNDAKSIWYTWTAPSTGLYKIRATAASGTWFTPVARAFTIADPHYLRQISGDPILLGNASVSQFEASEGETYWLQIDGLDSQMGTGTFGIRLISPPDNDLLENARELPSQAPLTFSGTTEDSSLERGETGYSSYTTGSVWFHWTPPVSGTYAITHSTRNLLGPITMVYTGTSIGSLVSAKSPGSSHHPEKFVFDGIAGVSYLFNVQAFVNQGQFQSSIEPVSCPANDLFANATVIGNLPAVIEGNNVHATLETGEPPSQRMTSSVWYQWTAPKAGIYRISKPDITFPYRLQIFSGNSLAEISSSAGSVDQWAHDGVTYFRVSEGARLHFRVSSTEDDMGWFSFMLAEDEDITGGHLEINRRSAGKIQYGGDVDEWTFTGMAGQSVRIGLSSAYPRPLYDIQIEMTDPEGTVIAIPSQNLPLSKSGTYRIRIQASSGSTGDYGIVVWETEPKTIPIQLDWQLGHSGIIRSPYAPDVWTFEGVAGQRINFQMLSSVLGTNFSLTGPNGWALPNIQNLGSEHNIFLPADGTYSLTVTNHASASGSYSFRFDVPKEVDLLARFRLTGVMVPDGTPDDSSTIQVTLFSESVMVPAAYQTGSITVTADGTGKRTWTSSGFLLNQPGVPHNAPWVAGQPVFINSEFSVPFKTETGVSKLQFSVTARGRFVKMYFSDAHVPLLPSGITAPANRGLHLLGIEAAGDTAVVSSLIPNRTSVHLLASSAATNTPWIGFLAPQFVHTLFKQDEGDSKLAYFGHSKARIEVFSYMDTYYQSNSYASISPAGAMNNFTVQEIAAPITRKASTLGSDVSIGVSSTAGERIEIQASDDLATWRTILTGLAKAGDTSIPLGSFSEKAKFFRVVYPDR